jgi:hypothetical protein
LSPSLLASYFATGVETVYLSDINVGSSTLPAGLYIVPKDKTLVISGNVPVTTGTVINAVDGTLDLSNGDITSLGTVTLHLNDRDRAAAAAGGKFSTGTFVTPVYLTAIPATGTISGDVVLSSLTLGTGGITPLALASYANSSGSKVYVAGDLVVNDSEIDIPSGVSQIVVYGDIRAEGNITLTDISNLDLTGSLKAAANITVTGLNNIGSIPLDTGSGYRVVVGVDSSNAALTILALANLKGTGTLVLDEDIGEINITTGTGNIEFTEDTVLSASSTITTTGTTSFKGTAEFSDAVAFTGPVNFADDLTVGGASGGVTFGRRASFAGGAVITLVAGTSIITLGQNGALANTSNIISNTTGTPAVFTPAAGATLAFSAAGITQGGAITLTGGPAVLGGDYTIKTSGTLTATGGLTIGPAGSIILSADSTNGAILAGAGAAASTSIEVVGGTNGWKAVGASGSVTISADTIAAASGAVLTAITGGTQPSITVLAGETLNIAAATTIDLQGSGGVVGSIVLKGDISDGAILAFARGTDSIVTTANTTAPAGDSSPVITNSPVFGIGLDVQKDSSGDLYTITSTDTDPTDLTIQAATGDATLNGATAVS